MMKFDGRHVDVVKWDIRVTREVEYESPDDYGYDPAVVKELKARKKSSPWGWCGVKLTAAPRGLNSEMRTALEGVEYLGACSYLDHDDFILNSPYYEQMVRDAKMNCISRIENILNTLTESHHPVDV